MSKKNTVILIIIAAIVVLALGIFLLFFTSPKTQTTVGDGSSSPFGNYNGSTGVTSPGTGTTTEPTEPAALYVNNPTSPLVRISAVPIAGAEVFDRKVSTSTITSIVRYIERATGHTAEYDRSTNLLSVSSNTTIPSIYQAFWSGNTVLAQFLIEKTETVRTFAGNLPASTTPATQLTGVFLPDGVYSLAISPKGTRVFMLPFGDNAVGSISNLDGTKKTSIFNFPFNEWTAEWPSEGTLTLTTRASFNAPGFMYFLSTGGSMTKVLGNVAGLTTRTSPSLGYTIYSESNSGGISTGIYDINKNSTLAFTGNPTLPEKCVWSKLSKTTAYCAVPATTPIANYPDDWYKGNISFVDNIYKVDLSLPAVQLIYSLPKDQNIDVINPSMDAKEENLYFTNKNDYFLWGLTIKSLSPIGL